MFLILKSEVCIKNSHSEWLVTLLLGVNLIVMYTWESAEISVNVACVKFWINFLLPCYRSVCTSNQGHYPTNSMQQTSPLKNFQFIVSLDVPNKGVKTASTQHSSDEVVWLLLSIVKVSWKQTILKVETQKRPKTEMCQSNWPIWASLRICPKTAAVDLLSRSQQHIEQIVQFSRPKPASQP